MVHGMFRFKQDHIVFRGYRQHLIRHPFAPDEKDAGHIGHFGRTDRLQVAESGDQDHFITIHCQYIAHQVAGKSTLHFMV